MLQGQIAYEGSCYDISKNKAVFEDAQYYCTSKGGDLVTINSRLEQDKITSIIAEHENEYFIGLHFVDSSFEWISGQVFDFDFWGAGEPSRSQSTILCCSLLYCTSFHQILD